MTVRVAYLHGFASSPASRKARVLGERLAARGHTLHVPDLRRPSFAHLSHDDVVTVNRLADHLHLSGAFVTIETGKLKKLGLIDKRADPDDKRKMRLTVTPVEAAWEAAVPCAYLPAGTAVCATPAVVPSFTPLSTRPGRFGGGRAVKLRDKAPQ